MPTYEYQCPQCRHRFEQRQAMADAPIEKCPDCGGDVKRLISGGTGFIVRGEGPGRSQCTGPGCNLEQQGMTCCGSSERCGTPCCS